MDQLRVPFLSSLNAESAFEEVDESLDRLNPQSLDHLLWSADGYKPKVWFTMAHNGQCVFLRYTVNEDHIRAVYNNINDPVYKDTCVEFFISFGNDANYYNLEFNCAGTCTAGYGSGKHNRQILSADAIKKIRSQTRLRYVNAEFEYCWDLTLIIPVTVFAYHKNINLNGALCRANFYKCGDDLPQPHFLAWSNISSEQPNFHLPEFFGNALFLSEQES
jgi:hypothetical protein